MKKSIIIKLVSIVTIAIFLQILSPFNVDAAAKIEWTNPNKNGKNPYKFKLTDSLNSALLVQVVGCTGIVDKISSAITNLESKISNKIKQKIKEQIAIKSCQAFKKSGTVAVAGSPGMSFTDVVSLTDCKVIKNSLTPALDELAATDKQNAQKATNQESCLGGIAKTLARNQLTAMTKYTMNWVTTGFNGDPMYVKNVDLFMGSLEKLALKKEIDFFAKAENANDYPYGRSFGIGYGESYNSGSDIHNALKQDLMNYIYTGDDSGTNTKITTKVALENYATNFAAGGWQGWLGLTQKEQNNPLGFDMLSINNIAKQQDATLANVKAKLDRNNGFLDQEKCVAYNDDEEKEIQKNHDFNVEYEKDVCDETSPNFNESECYDATALTDESTKELASFEKECIKYETVTPGSLIKDKVSTTLNSDIRQLELAKDINDSLNAVFTVLLNKLQIGGLTSLTSSGDGYYDATLTGPSGFGSNNFRVDTVDANGKITSSSTGAGFNGSIDLTKELGNTFIHVCDTKAPLIPCYIPVPQEGGWNAGNNTPKLYPNYGISPNTYYEVIEPGQTRLMNEGYNEWEKGDRAYFDGTEWQNWKKGQANPIEKRGIIQIQKDYVVAAKEILKVIPSIMPKLGELDACIPGPNPNWETNIYNTSTAFLDFINTLSTSYKGNGFLNGTATNAYNMAGPGDAEYENYHKIFDGTRLWSEGVLPSYAVQATLAKINMGSLEKQEKIDVLLSRINSHVSNFVPLYKKFIDELYGPNSPMQNEFKKNEKTGFEYINGEKVRNEGYLPMAQAGLEITKDMLSYDEANTQSIEDYKNGIAEANANVAKLDQIKTAVNAIVAEAQYDRYLRLKDILSKEKLTEEQYKEKYKECLDEEEVNYYDEDAIMVNNSIKENCKDGIDNDLDGLVDEKDPDCEPDYVAPFVDSNRSLTPYDCSTDTSGRIGCGTRNQ